MLNARYALALVCVALATQVRVAHSECHDYYSKADCDGKPINWAFQGHSPCELLAENGASTLAVIGDYGMSDRGCEAKVVSMLTGWESAYGQVASIFTTGDNNYWEGHCSTLDKNVGQYFGKYFSSSECIEPESSEAAAEPLPARDGGKPRFWPTLGNHDANGFTSWIDLPYIQYFAYLADYAPKTYGEQYGYGMFYNVTVTGQDGTTFHLFSVNSMLNEPDYDKADPALSDYQKEWLQTSLEASTADVNIVYFHHAPYCSALHDPLATWMSVEEGWDYQGWGADIVFTGHEHVYERVERDYGNGPFYYVVNGLGGMSWLYNVLDSQGCDPIEGSQVRYNANHGMQFAASCGARTDFCFFSAHDGTLIDHFTVGDSSAMCGLTCSAATTRDSCDAFTECAWTHGSGSGECVSASLVTSIDTSTVAETTYSLSGSGSGGEMSGNNVDKLPRSHGLSKGGVAGIVVACLIVVAAGVAAVVVRHRRANEIAYAPLATDEWTVDPLSGERGSGGFMERVSEVFEGCGGCRCCDKGEPDVFGVAGTSTSAMILD